MAIMLTRSGLFTNDVTGRSDRTEASGSDSKVSKWGARINKLAAAIEAIAASTADNQYVAVVH